MSRPVTDLPSPLRDLIGEAPLIVFDGECVLCDGFFRFIIDRDRDDQFRFATAQSPTGTAVFAALGLKTTDWDTNIVIIRGEIHTELSGFFAAMRRLGFPYALLAPLGYLPNWILSPIYKLIARNRYRWFGRYHSCILPTPDLRARFLAGGY